MRAYVEAYGCTLNFGEAKELEEILSGLGWNVVEGPEECDLAIVATCVVIETTERAMLKRIKALAAAPRLVITGCMATACREKAEKVAPRAVFLAPGDFDSFRDMLGSPVDTAKVVRGSSACSIVPIATGCRGQCAYCITKLARGELMSRPPERVVAAVSRAVASGPREIQLTAQDTAAYGADAGTNLPALVSRLCALERDFRIRIGMMNPASALPLVDGLCLMYRDPKVFKFLHLPVQSGNEQVLSRMARGYSVGDFRRMVDRIRKEVPRITLSTDIIAGYPGEDEVAHEDSLKLITNVQPDIVNVTRFSPRPGTAASRNSDPVPGWMAKERSREITSLRFEVSLRRNRAWIGKEMLALATEKGKGDSTILRTDEYKQVVVDDVLELGQFRRVQITESTPTYLLGRLADG